jgi:hypothetical protein
MLETIIVMGQDLTGVVGRIDIDAFHFTGEHGFQGLQGKKVIAKDEVVVDEIATGIWAIRSIRPGRVFTEGLQGQIPLYVLADPGKFGFQFPLSHVWDNCLR